MTSTYEIDGDIQKQMGGGGAVGARKGITLFISNEYLDNTTKTIKQLESSRVLTDDVSKTVKHEITKQKVYQELQVLQGQEMLGNILTGKG